ncbi:rho guanine nucleotide exchange factor 38 isoform X2 [Microcaecilia unicolor]|uniref:Rho guanine nucleotide exchange factor 38 n=1 Tax=Microcaecilia unicolor TaxID=1415580 RepID=A0A6P7XCP2_9AMPH|nr:rho guanine nucleotide exchange factor 38 isoform X2 [Microcaecilia unicolor]
MEAKETTGKEPGGAKRKNLTFLKQRLYMTERRKTDTIVESGGSMEPGTSGTIRRSQSDRTEYNQKLKEKMTPHAGSSAPTTPTQEPEELQRRRMAKRSKIIGELVQTEKDYLKDLELCIREVVQPLRNKQIEGFDVDVLFSNIESVCQISAKLLSLLEEATTDVEPDIQVIGELFLQIKGPLEDVYKIYCYHHDDSQMVLESYEKDEELKQHLTTCIQSLTKIYLDQGKSNLLDIRSLMIKPIQRITKYPLLLCEMLNSTPTGHPDCKALQDAYAAVKDINANINELKRGKDLVLKYRRNDEDESLKDKLSKLNIHSISKKSKRVTSHLKILTGGEPQIKDQIFNKEEKIFRSLEKTVRLCVKNISYTLQHMQDAMPLGAQNIMELQDILCSGDGKSFDPDALSTAGHPYKDFVTHLDRLVLVPLITLQAMFPGPQKLIQKRYDKLLDYNSCLQKSSGDELDQSRKDYEALNAQLVEELQVFNKAARKIVYNCLHCFVTLLRELIFTALHKSSAAADMFLLSSCISEVQNRVMEKLQNLHFVKESNSGTFIERKLSFEKKKSVPSIPEPPRQTDSQRSKLLATYSADKLYQAKRKCNATQELDIDLYEGELVALVEQKDPLGSTSRWFVDTGSMQGYVYSSFLKSYNSGRSQKVVADNGFSDDDFDNISLFVSLRPTSDSTAKMAGGSASDGSPFHNGLRDKPEINGTETDSSHDMEDQHIFYAVYAFQARSHQELSLQEYQRVRILRFSDLSGNKEWWLAEAEGQKGYVPASYLGKMTYA